MYTPPVIDKDVEYAQDDNEENRRPLGLEANSDHNAGGKSKQGEENAPNAPSSLQDDPQEKENQEYTASEEDSPLSVM